ncbi:UDP-N-acetylmuramyl-tripeptide synthetase [Candidatus Peribacteria bacterium]|nr:UDP-N-acetylmuramyl-tripeptide synthetase [Candidatus Peribacteria bacterium]
MSMRSLLKKLFPETSALRLFFHRFKALLAAIRYGFPAKSLRIIGITGTDGKTTTVGMIAHMLNACGIKTGAVSTAFFSIGNDIRWNATQKTSPSPFMVQKFLRELVNTHCTHAVIECSSHGLLQGRVNHTYPTVAAITNISEEHLDYHGSMDEYIAAKAILFEMLRGNGTKVLHFSDRSFSSLAALPSQNTILYEREETNIDSRTGPALNLWLEETEVTDSGSSGTVVWNPRGSVVEERLPIVLSLRGDFNLDNALCAIACVFGLPESPDCSRAVASLSSFAGVPGRMEQIDMGQSFSVFVDFTVTPKSYEATLHTLRSILPPEKRLLVLAGSCGDRMKQKRPMIGNLCSTHADVSIITNEDPYTEDPEAIIDEILSGVSLEIPIFRGATSVPEHVPEKCCIRISDRLESIRMLLRMAHAEDIVLFCGKGSDTTMMSNIGQIPWNEREIVRMELRRMRP